MLFNKGNTRTPLSSIIGGRAKTTNHVEFVTGQEFTSGGGAQPAISESASLTAPDATVVTRAQKTNVTQIFQESVGISYGKMSNMGTLSGINVAGQQANPMNELDFQVAAKMMKVNADIEYTFITDMPATFEEWRTQLLAGTATLDIGLNAAGCDVVGTALTKANMLSDTTKSALELSGSDPTVNDALYALSQKGSPAEVRVIADIGSTVTMSRGGKTLTGKVASTGYATLYPTELGDWTIVFTYSW